MHSSSDVTGLLKAWRGGDETALDRLTPLVYSHLRKLGRQYLRKERASGRADATSLVHEAFVRLVDARTVDWQDRAHFFAVSSTIMRRILVDAARARGSAKRGGDLQRVEDDGATMGSLRAPDRAAEICALDDALNALAAREPRRAKVVELRYFGGLSVDETAEALAVSPQTVLRDWKLARAWLTLELKASRRP